ncbi:3-oxoacyl-[acyl-carrier-protein] synthase III [Prochlorococcus marinus str. MIT 9515]|uniref:Beta-ketoacyl-[acyl-carrier-protein] synthase III n=1 Tax=Prochlorococcus marinus (strain MIT 9515) TaxID=167542 RepID=FABH_PROM5|nr:beta-ketoacyl-ACP synthase III [Prochlorococcus marinus]A2BUB2.1 RecName: Full=Beta-ketoacyl-[acyl-carrier-protein] synthase III; Short=Beta-ketoacyl-ACP synthase III; Short=KAS III; AltName: Full=3-oxoacyl-[acyl-carrier-protein] synthase 3; AltName: Full=3-oxoacyl-[acyl-carrier-protein] synthase III [Prochlorococcus marinus str. MIT 9515]ABM71373.1 3-oxoacyl-[acyl-carrier-protein] synthase III [Prochlorococcus marinus str. MIT 9515]
MEVINSNQIGVSFKGSGSYVPHQILTNHEISKKVDTSDEWIKSRTGISQRRISGLSENVSEMGYKAGLAAIEMAKWDIETIDLIILATSTPHDLFGSAPEIQSKLGANNAVAFDLTAACSGFLFAVITATQFLKAGSYRRAIVIGSDQLSSYVDWNDRRSCILFGDGAGALAIEATNEFDNLIGFSMRTDGQRGSFLNLPSQKNNDQIIDNINFSSGGFSTIAMNGQEVYKFAVREVPLIIDNLFKKTNFNSEKINWLLLHQANQRILDSVGDRLNISSEKILSNLSNYGNTSAATIPLMLDEAIRNKKIKENDIIATSGFGAGLSWGAALIRWG